ncbi:AAA family ATPase [Medicago truncatula]|uniref:AAA family ATPase n=1 Tax=Medicago truncatula TaxID=3880 RepID=A0A072U8Z2_MEDTR|nr:AAA family ATPase [Medicago truncatula]
MVNSKPLRNTFLSLPSKISFLSHRDLKLHRRPPSCSHHRPPSSFTDEFRTVIHPSHPPPSRILIPSSFSPSSFTLHRSSFTVADPLNVIIQFHNCRSNFTNPFSSFAHAGEQVIRMVGEGGDNVGAGSSNSKMPTLEEYGTNLIKLAEEGKLDPVVGRQPQIERVTQILGRLTKNNPCLIGEPGVGKTAIAEGLAQRIANGDVPETIEGKQVITLDMGLLVAGSKYRGEFEERLNKLMEEIKQSDEIILFIDEVHTLIGAEQLKGDKFGKIFKEVDQNSGVNKMAVKAWNSMSNEDKQHYLDKAAKRKAKHEKLEKKGQKVEYCKRMQDLMKKEKENKFVECQQLGTKRIKAENKMEG